MKKCENLARNGDIEKLRQFFTDYRAPDAYVVELHVTRLLECTLLGGISCVEDDEYEDVGDRGELLRLLIHYGADGASDVEGIFGASPIYLACYPAEKISFSLFKKLRPHNLTMPGDQAKMAIFS